MVFIFIVLAILIYCIKGCISSIINLLLLVKKKVTRILYSSKYHCFQLFVKAAQKKDHLLDGTRVWDGGTFTARMFTQFQATLPDPWLMSGIGAKMETKERMKESNSEKGENMGCAKDKEQITAVQYGDTNVEVASKMGEVKEEEVEMQTKNATHQDRVEDNTQENTCPVQKTIRSPSLEESEAPTQHRLQQPHSPVEEPKECWGKYDFLIPDITETSKLLCEFASANTQMHPKLSGECAEPYLHVPAGPGLAQAMQCPLLQFNAIYCYLPKQLLSTFEGDQNAFTTVILRNAKVKRY